MATDNLKIALTMIVKDDSEIGDLRQALESFKPYIDGLYVAVTGVSKEHKQTHKLIKQFGGKSISTSPETHPKIYSKIDDKWIFSNFAEARNVSWSLVDKYYDYLTWCDTDDILAYGDELRKVAQMGKDKKMDSINFVYWYSNRFNDQGQVTQVDLQHVRERLLRPNKFKWVSRLHEVAVPVDNFQPKIAIWDFDPKKNQNCVWVHTASIEKITGSVDRNATILEIQAKEENYEDPRTLFYLAKTYFDMGRDNEAEKHLTTYLEKSGWDAERANAHEYLALIKMRKNQLSQALEVLFAGIREYPAHHIMYLRVSDCYFKMGQNEFGSFWLDMASRMPEPKAEATIGNNFELKLLLASLKWNECKVKNDIDGMLKWSKVRIDILGKDDGLYQSCLDIKNFNTACNGVMTLSKWMDDNGHKAKIPALLETLPSEIGQEPFVSMIYNNVTEPKVWGDKEIAYYASFGAPHFEQWGVENLKKGIGGSETAVIELSREWVKLGYKVTVYCDCGDQAGVHEGVTYKPWYQINWNDEFNILILWRSPHLVNKDTKAKKLYMDLHDVPSMAHYDEDKIERLDKIFVKSQYHRSLLPKIPDNKFIIISNGIRTGGYNATN